MSVLVSRLGIVMQVVVKKVVIFADPEAVVQDDIPKTPETATGSDCAEPPRPSTVRCDPCFYISMFIYYFGTIECARAWCRY